MAHGMSTRPLTSAHDSDGLPLVFVTVFTCTAPVDGKKYDHYHWHWEIFPKTATWAGFEIGTGIEISTIEPEKAAQFLRKQ